MMQTAENFLVRCLKPTKDLETLITCVLLLLIAIPSKWTLRQFPSRQSMHERIFKGILSTTAMDTSPFKDASLEMNAESYGFTL